jgi:hypothetical protein
MASTFGTLPGIQDKRQAALDRKFDPGQPLSHEMYLKDNFSIQQFERGKFEVTKYWLNFNGTPVDAPEAGGSGPFWDVNFYPDIDELLARFTKA